MTKASFERGPARSAADQAGQDLQPPRQGASNAGGGLFEIRVQGHLDRQWSDWLEGLELEFLDNGEMVLSGAIVDQAALLGVLNKLNRLNLSIVSVREVSHKPG